VSDGGREREREGEGGRGDERDSRDTKVSPRNMCDSTPARSIRAFIQVKVVLGKGFEEGTHVTRCGLGGRPDVQLGSNERETSGEMSWLLYISERSARLESTVSENDCEAACEGGRATG
jgi:hypothetical protein